MKTDSFFDREARLAVHLVSLFHPLPLDFISRFADDLSWPGLALNEELLWSEAFIGSHRMRFNPDRIFQNPSIAWTDSMRKLLPPSMAKPLVHTPMPSATTIGEAMTPWSHGCPLAKSRPLASLTLEEAGASLVHLDLGRLLASQDSPWTPAWSQALGPRLEETHGNVTNAASLALRRVYDDLCVPALGDAPLAFLEAFFARTPHYAFCSVALGDAYGVLPGIEVDVHAFTALEAGKGVAAAVNSYAQGPARMVPIGGAKLLMKGACVVMERAWKEAFASFVMPPHAFHEVALAKSKKAAGDPVVLRFEGVFQEGDVLAQRFDVLIAERMDKGLSIQMPQLIVSHRVMAMLRAQEVPFLTFSPAAVMRFTVAEDADAPPALVPPRPVEVAPIVLTKSQEFFAAKRARMMASKASLPASLPASHKPANNALGKAETRLARIFPLELAAFMEANGARFQMGPLRGYRLLPAPSLYLLDQHGYELEHPESWGAVAIAENGVGDCIGLLLRKNSDHELGATLYEFMHETGRIRKLAKKL